MPFTEATPKQKVQAGHSLDGDLEQFRQTMHNVKGSHVQPRPQNHPTMCLTSLPQMWQSNV
jgi:hypothetical protein